MTLCQHLPGSCANCNSLEFSFEVLESSKMTFDQGYGVTLELNQVEVNIRSGKGTINLLKILMDIEVSLSFLLLI